jgi:NAD(P)-dependent dehydrogenase (short-subunit alcohol dehydrogenase family)
MNSRIILITGGSRGLGRNSALHLARQGADILLTYVANPGEAETAVREIQKLGRRAQALRLDVGSSSTFESFADEVRSTLQAWGAERLQALVNNAGIGIHATFQETTEEQFDRLMAVHLKGTFFLTQKLLPLIADGGQIVNLSSGLARFSLPGYSAYATMKGGVEVLTRYLAKELGPRRITVNVLAPGAIETDFGGGAVRDNPAVNQFVASQTAMGRAGLPDDIGEAMTLLLSDEARWITGQRLEVSGGMFL